MLISAVSAMALIYQSRVIGAQYAATIWPYLTVRENYNLRQQQIVLANDGMGPALIHSARLEVDGRSVPSWTEYMARLTAEIKAGRPQHGQRIAFTAQGVGAGSTLRPGASLTLFSASFSRGIASSAINVMLKHRLALRFCYCSLNGSCWTMQASSSGPISMQVPVHVCGSPSIIDASAGELATPVPQK
jgi:hypothetical protein